ncbi:MAG: sigma-70 family RNA polymerase sigma factor [Phycisphaerae bacterium]|nr:sigma-70 family RNA polymerase sigma factor [Phycisphaerae bacterium]
MSLNKYGDSAEQWKVDLIVRRARFFGFGQEDIQDIQQELVLKLMTFNFDVEKSNGAQETTVLQGVVDNELKMRLRVQKRRDDHIEALRWMTNLSDNPSKALLPIDIKKAMLYLPDKQRQICIALSKGHSTGAIAHALRVDQRTIQRHIRKIRAYFMSLNLHQWLAQ